MSINPDPRQNYDIAILGSGISCSLTLLHLLEKLLCNVKATKTTHIVVVEKNKEFWKGYPYGSRSSLNSLTITTLGEFVPEKEKENFIEWLEKTQEDWLSHLQTNGNKTSETWLANNLPHIKKHQWDDLYVPRFLFGNFVKEKLDAAIESAREKGIADVNPVHAEAIGISKKMDYEITVENKDGVQSAFSTHIVLLAIGSPPVKSVQSAALQNTHCYTYINDTYMPSLEANLSTIQKVLSGVTDREQRNIVMIGSNASSLELLYLISHREELKKLINKIVVISYSGILPHRITPNDFPDYYFEELAILKQNKKYSPAELMAGIEKDLDTAFEKGVHIGDTYYQLSDLVVELINNMALDEQKEFFNTYGMKFTKLIRRAGAEYRDAAEGLIKDHTLKLIKGKFLQLERSGDGKSGVSFSYSNPGTEPTVYPASFPLVINCGGFEDLNFSSSRIIASLIKNKLCTINSTYRGFDVNEKFEAHDNLYIMGPLLGGIFNSKARFWHVENAKRIYTLGGMVAQVLIDYLNN